MLPQIKEAKHPDWMKMIHEWQAQDLSLIHIFSSCFLKLTLETRDAAQIEQIRAELTKEGFQLVSERV